ncbi:hypothetical protein RJ640_021962 [Escallonia rubra]|uniref:Uncharacterized protein n=1 Tax=Escallonia rubra TaxID=112253 RepID=A0AA88R6V8_9ASTE|nr:hypothetical protein RJ640_021962 [Escallonia rubra]
MCPNRDWFATYCSFDGGKVLMGNNVTCKVVEIGSIQIRIHDGIVRTFTEVRHVPELRKILISLGTLDSNGCSYRAAGGVMRIMKGALVVMKGLKQNSLYLLQGSTVTGAAAAASSSDIDSDTTKLWHMRLGNMSERGMDMLSKQVGPAKLQQLQNMGHGHKPYGRPQFSNSIRGQVSNPQIHQKKGECIVCGKAGYYANVCQYRKGDQHNNNSRHNNRRAPPRARENVVEANDDVIAAVISKVNLVTEVKG